jgi:uncharacterized protein (TIGR02996 family)
MSDDEAAFLRTIRENPDADLPRLVYADWLQEHGETLRAEFLRAHLELERLTEDSPRRRELAFWCRTQLDTQSHLLFEPPLQPKFARYGRGLVEAAEFWNASDGEIASAFHLAPLRRVWVYGHWPYFSHLLNIPEDNCLRTLDMTGNRLTADEMIYVGVMPFPHLKELVLTGCNLDDEAAQIMCEHPFYQKLERIHVGGNPFSDEGRQRLREQFGERISFSGTDGCDPARLYSIRPSERYEAGLGNDLTQLSGEMSYDESRLCVFDCAGNLLDVQDEHHSSTVAGNEALAESLAVRGLRRSPIRVKRFNLPNGLGLIPYPSWLIRALNRESDAFTSPSSVHTAFEVWLADGRCTLGLAYGVSTLKSDGELIPDIPD